MNFRTVQKAVAALIVGLLVVLATVYFAHLSDHRYDPGLNKDALDSRLRKLAGASAKDCGSVALGQDGAPSVACAKESLASSRPFFFSGQIHGIDSKVWQGIARNSDGAMWSLIYDDDVTGGSPIRRAYLGVDSCHSALIENSSREYILCK